ncbi:glutamate racemase [Saccharospirillum mangrovi]|uniref:glutamate racemase n=1 Tax=Saccharospirillum mangrovi TaxID=2161747 RepID=UPI000D363A33|nr:glutamate racemase [Saccharospirillum mangrovi]
MIGVFDSGIGGLTVLRWVRQRLPQAPLLYVADQRWSPYGAKPSWLLQQRCDAIADWLIHQGATLLVVACNTATAHCVEALRKRLTVVVVGVEPGIKPAALGSRTGTIGILATENTLASSRYQDLAARFNPNTRILNQPCPHLADAIERGPDNPDIDRLLHEYVPGLVEAGVDRLVLGCTHYPLVRERIQALIGSGIRLIDTGEAIAAEVGRRYQSIPGETASTRLLTTGDAQRLRKLIQAYPSLNAAFSEADCAQAPAALLDGPM